MRRLNERELIAYDVVPRAIAQRARVIRVPVLLPGISGMTLGRFVLLVGDDAHDGRRKLLAHELVHVQQWYELGVVRFLARYLSSYAVQLLRHRRHRRAYFGIGLEAEAYARADEWASTRATRVAHDAG
jgi:hypothetical protein